MQHNSVKKKGKEKKKAIISTIVLSGNLGCVVKTHTIVAGPTIASLLRFLFAFSSVRDVPPDPAKCHPLSSGDERAFVQNRLLNERGPQYFS